MANDSAIEDRVPAPFERLRIYREYARQARQNAEAAVGPDVQAFLMEAAQWDRAAIRLERSMIKDSG